MLKDEASRPSYGVENATATMPKIQQMPTISATVVLATREAKANQIGLVGPGEYPTAFKLATILACAYSAVFLVALVSSAPSPIIWCKVRMFEC